MEIHGNTWKYVEIHRDTVEIPAVLKHGPFPYFLAHKKLIMRH